MRLGPMLDPLLTADIINTDAGRLPPSSERPTRPKVIDSLSLISRRPSRMPARGHVLWGRSGWSASRVRLGKSLGGVLDTPNLLLLSLDPLRPTLPSSEHDALAGSNPAQ